MNARRETREVVGLVPAAGLARRLGPLPCSKEIYPVGFEVGPDPGPTPKAVGQYLLEKLRKAGIRKTYVVLRAGKWDIPAYLGDGHRLGLNLAYLMMRRPFGVPYTLDDAFPFVRDSTVAFGFPDHLFGPEDAYVRLLTKQAATGADVVLGLFAPDRPSKMDMVELDPEGRIRSIAIKPERTDLKHAWAIAVWTPVFSEFMLDHVNEGACGDDGDPTDGELHLGAVFQAAVAAGLRIQTVIFRGQSCLDIGTPDDLVRVTGGGSAPPPDERPLALSETSG